MAKMQSKSTQEMGYLIRASYPTLYIVTDEIDRLVEEVQLLCDSYLNKSESKQSGKFTVYRWDCLNHWVSKSKKIPAPQAEEGSIPTPLADLQQVVDFPPFSLCVLENFHFYLNNQAPDMIQLVRNLARHCQETNKTLIFANSIQEFPREVESQIHIVDHDLPGIEDINKIVDLILESMKEKGLDIKLTSEQRYSVVEACKGMRLSDIENALAYSIVFSKTLDAKFLQSEKCKSIKKSGQLEYIDHSIDFSSIGGCENAKQIIRKAKITLGPKAKQYNLDPMKAFLFLGVPGCCKSEFVKACGMELGIPILKMDLSRMFGSLVGQSEHNIRTALKTVDSMAPCIVWIDEFDKGMSGVGGSGAHDGGTTVRVGGVLLTWMNDHTSQVIVMCTANDVSAIPPEYLRKGRFSEIVFFDIPSPKERTEIFKVQLLRQKLSPSKYDISALVEASGHFTGAEIMYAISDSKMSAAFKDTGEPTTDDVLTSIGNTIPEAKKNKVRIEAVRQRASEIATPASIPEKVSPTEVTIGTNKFKAIQA